MLQTVMVSNNTDLKVMFDQSRPDTIIQHTIAERAVLRVYGDMKCLFSEGEEQVHGAVGGMDGPHAVDQGQGCELHSSLRGQESSDGGQHSVPRDDQEGYEGTPGGRAGGHGHRERQPEQQQPGSNLILMKTEFAPHFVMKEQTRV
jgi:hypothetical protein